jgi:hypothetical protein
MTGDNWRQVFVALAIGSVPTTIVFLVALLRGYSVTIVFRRGRGRGRRDRSSDD